jgi:hypothetical protein
MSFWKAVGHRRAKDWLMILNATKSSLKCDHGEIVLVSFICYLVSVQYMLLNKLTLHISTMEQVSICD